MPNTSFQGKRNLPCTLPNECCVAIVGRIGRMQKLLQLRTQGAIRFGDAPPGRHPAGT